MTEFFRNFSEYSEGDLATVGAADWTSSTLSGDWTLEVVADGGPGGIPALVSDRVVSGDAFALSRFTASETTGDIEVFGRHAANAYSVNIGFGPALIASDNAAYALAAVSGTEVRLWRFGASGGTSGNIATATFSLVAGTAYNIRLGRSGTTIRAKIWAVGDSEPGTWMMSGTDSTLTTVQAGVYARKFEMQPQVTTAFGVGTAGDTAPTSGVAAHSITGSVTHALTPGATMAFTAATVTVSGTQVNGRELRDENQAVIASQTISYEWYDKTTDTDGDPLQSGTFNTDANGEWSITLSGSVLGNGANGTLILEFGADRGIYELPVVRS